jgi:hypothetical protein
MLDQNENVFYVSAFNLCTLNFFLIVGTFSS